MCAPNPSTSEGKLMSARSHDIMLRLLVRPVFSPGYRRHSVLLITVIGLLWGVPLSTCEEDVDLCPPSQEGEPLTLYCSGTSRTIDRQVFWDRIPSALSYDDDVDEDAYETVSFCGFQPGSSRCTDYQPLITGTQMITDRIPHQFSVSLKLYALQAINRSAIFFCTLFEEGQMHTLFSCRLNTYLVPAEPRCWAEEIKDQGRSSDVRAGAEGEGQALGGSRALVRVTCTTPRMYPDVNCELHQKRNKGEEKKVQAEIIKTTRVSLKQPQDRQAECRAEFYVDLPGTYEYRVNMSPLPQGEWAGGFESLQLVTSKYSKPVDIVLSGLTIDLTQSEPVNICPFDTSGKTIAFTCTARKFKTPPRFEWRVTGGLRGQSHDLSKLKPRTQSVRELQDMTYQATAQYLPEELASVAEITCFVQDAEISDRDHVVSVEVKRLNPENQPAELVFKMRTPNGPLPVGTALTIKENEDVILECVPEPALQDVETYMTCSKQKPNDSSRRQGYENDVGGSAAEFSIGKDNLVPRESLSNIRHSEVAIHGTIFAPKRNCSCWAKSQSSGLCFRPTRSVTVNVISVTDLLKLPVPIKLEIKAEETVTKPQTQGNDDSDNTSNCCLAVLVGVTTSVLTLMLIGILLLVIFRQRCTKQSVLLRFKRTNRPIIQNMTMVAQEPRDYDRRHPGHEEETAIVTTADSNSPFGGRDGSGGPGRVSVPLLHHGSNQSVAILRSDQEDPWDPGVEDPATDIIPFIIRPALLTDPRRQDHPEAGSGEVNPTRPKREVMTDEEIKGISSQEKADRRVLGSACYILK